MTNQSNNPALNKRQIRPQIDPLTGNITFLHNLTESRYVDTVDCVVQPVHVLPIVFVPGVMGSNLCDQDPELTNTEEEHAAIKDVWLVDGVTSMANWIFKNNGERQKALHPDRTFVYDRGDVPGYVTGVLTSQKHYWKRGWGEVGAMSYQTFLVWLENQLNGGSTNERNHARLNETLKQLKDGELWHAQKPFSPLTSEESEKAVQWTYPVHACGYNWLDDSAKSAKRLGKRINEIIDFYNKKAVCKQVIIVSHSLGGLVSRYCSEVDNDKLKHKAMREKIAGIVHGVMPSVGAAMAYRRCKVGMWEEDKGASLVIGRTGKAITAVFAQSPGTLQLLPSKQYPVSSWLEIRDSDGNFLPDQPKTDDPYTSIYKNNKNWWGLVKEEWLTPNGAEGIKWQDYIKNINIAENFHDKLADQYHANTWGFYGTMGYEVKNKRAHLASNSFARITWVLEHGDTQSMQGAPSGKQIMAMSPNDVAQSGSNPIDVRGPTMLVPMQFEFNGTESVPTSYFRLRMAKAKDSGDGTVPMESASHPCKGPSADSIQQFIGVPGIAHEPAYKRLTTQHIAAYSIAKIAAKVPLPKQANT